MGDYPELTVPDGTPDFLADPHAIEVTPQYANTPMRTGHARNRRVYTVAPRVVSVGLRLTQPQMTAFADWFEGPLCAGGEWFSAHVRRQGPGLLWWKARFAEPYTAEPKNARWNVSARLLLVGVGTADSPYTPNLRGGSVAALVGAAILRVPVSLAGGATVALLPAGPSFAGAATVALLAFIPEPYTPDLAGGAVVALVTASVGASLSGSATAALIGQAAVTSTVTFAGSVLVALVGSATATPPPAAAGSSPYALSPFYPSILLSSVLRNAAYTGPCMRIVRTSDGAQADIPFGSSGHMDDATINSFLHGDTASVVTWYDQSGHGRNASQGDTGRQPMLATTGGINKQGGIPCPLFDGYDDVLVIPSCPELDIGSADYAREILVFPTSNGSGQLRFIDSRNFGNTNLDLMFMAAAQLDYFIGGANHVINSVPPPYDQTSNILVSRSSGNVNAAVNGTFSGGGFYDATNISGSALGIGSDAAAGYGLQGSILEVRLTKGSAVKTSNYAAWGVSSTEAPISLVGAASVALTGSATATPPPAAASGSAPLDAYTAGLWGAYSVNRLLSGYAGPCMRVRRDLDSAEMDIGFAAGALDAPAVVAFCGSGSGFVSIAYDQSGQGHNLLNTDSSQQPRIVNSGVYDGKIVFNPGTTVSQKLASTSLGGTGSAKTVFRKVNTRQRDQYNLDFHYFDGSGTQAQYLTLGSADYSVAYILDASGASVCHTSWGAPGLQDGGTQAIVMLLGQSPRYSGTRIYRNGQLYPANPGGSGDDGGTLTSFSARRWSIGSQNDSYPSHTDLWTCLIYDADKSDDAAAISMGIA